jgi:hypothetical protein
VKVLLLIVDSLRADGPGFGGGRDTPNLDGLAAEGTRFDQAHASGSWTIPSLVSMLTGSFPHRVGVCRWRHRFEAGRPTLLSAFVAAGFDVRCLLPNPRWGLRTLPGRGRMGQSQDPAAVQEALQGPGDRLVVVHHWWTHLPYLQQRLPRKGWRRACDAALAALGRHPEELAPRLEELYRRAVTSFDRELLPRYLDAAASSGEPVLVALTGDHGENWGEALPAGRRVEHIFDLHGRWLHDCTTSVPLVFQGPGVPPGGLLGGFARGVDLGPTLCELAGVPWPGVLPTPDPVSSVHRGLPDEGAEASIEGVSLASSIRAGVDAPCTSALTVASHNVFFPDTYPESGATTWRRYGLRTADARFLRDLADGERSAVGIGGPPPTRGAAEQVWGELERQWRSAVDPGAPVPEQAFGEPSRSKETDLEASMRTLGYLD